MNTSKRLTVTTALALTLSLGLTACGDDEPDVEEPANDPAATAPAETAADGDADDTDDGGEDTETADDTSDAGADDADDADNTADATDDDAEDSSGAGAGADGDLTAIALVAIETAQAEAGGTAYEIDDQDDDGTWEVDVRVDDRSIEVTVSADGTQVVGTEDDDLDDDDRAALDASTITLPEAIELAVGEAGGVLDDAELEGEDDGQPHRWQVTIDTGEQDDLEVLVSVTGEVLGTETDD